MTRISEVASGDLYKNNMTGDSEVTGDSGEEAGNVESILIEMTVS
ncbi:hypothetical protein [Vibrio quintilis]|uniref:Uncharacterized protein n=1 Tax=Vibrio quintilis TaxID=1117707 RepID=A0A1M7YZZ2_9VIBR|nr:hypothetical protein [Vibrio quintilis]SHO58016.1 hypothetical protein VQ7734_03786 [Vibrio quintilis]